MPQSSGAGSALNLFVGALYYIVFTYPTATNYVAVA